MPIWSPKNCMISDFRETLYKQLLVIHLMTHNIFLLFLQGGWSVPIELVIGPDLGISYLTDRATQVIYQSISCTKNG